MKIITNKRLSSLKGVIFMLDFERELAKLYAQVKQEYFLAPYIRMDYPANVTHYNWDDVVNESIVPPMTGYFFDS